MFDVYVKETHPDMNFQPKTFEERIQLYEEYQQEYGMTIPALIDNMKNEWLNLYKPGPTGCILIDKRGIVIYTIQFVMSAGSYSTIDNEVSKLLDAIDQNTAIQNNDLTTAGNSFSITQSTGGGLSIVIPNTGSNSVEVFSVRGSQIFSGNGIGSTTYTINEPMTPGKYLFRIKSDHKTIIKPMIIHR